MKFLNDKYLKIFLITCILIISLSIVYYLVIFLPHKSELDRQRLIQNDIEEKEMNCIEDAKKFHNDYIKTINRGSYFDPRYGYNKSTGECLYSGGHIDNTSWERFVKNVYTNETLLYTFKESPAIDDFWEKHDQLFGDK